MSNLAQATHLLLVLIEMHGPATVAELLDLPDAQIGPVLEDESLSVRGRIMVLRDAELVIGTKRPSTAATEYEITDKGRLVRLQGYSEPYVGQVAAPRTSVVEGDYDGAELRPFTARPGAMDAFAKPSLQGGQVVERRPPVLMGSKEQGPVR